MKRLLLLSLLCLLPAALSAAEVTKIGFEGPTKDSKNVLVSAPVNLPANSLVTVSDPTGKNYTAQVRHGSLSLGTDKSVLVVLVPEWKAGQKLDLKVTDVVGKASHPFEWTTHDGHPLLTRDQKPVLEYMNDKHDNTSPAGHYSTFKLFHHVYDPVEGKTLLSSSAYKSVKDGLYPHHRGLFYGFNKVSYGDKKVADVWHGTKNEFISDEGVIASDAGNLLGAQRLAIDWHGQDEKAFAKEQRELTVYNITGGTLIDFVSTVKTDLPKVHLDGDPQHAGFHFRANQEVAKNQKDVPGVKGKLNTDTYYLRQDGKGKGGETRNWDPKSKQGPVDLEWNAMSFVVGGKRYTSLYMDNPKNPKEARYSERDYGRFGSYFEYDLTPEKPLTIRYRIWFQEGEMTIPQCQEMSDSFLYSGKAMAE